MGIRKNAGSGAPPFLGGIMNTAMGKQAYSETGKTITGRNVTGYGSTPERAHADYLRKGGRI